MLGVVWGARAGWQTHLLRSDYSVVSKVGPKDSQEALLTNYDMLPRVSGSRPCLSLWPTHRKTRKRPPNKSPK